MGNYSGTAYSSGTNTWGYSSGTSTWGQWNERYYTAMTTSGTTWVRWNDESTTDCSFVVDNWVTWNSGYYHTVQQPVVKKTLAQQNDERILAEERMAEEIKRRVEEKRKAEEALVKSKKILIENLTEEQLRRFENDECIPVDTEKGNKYLIRKHTTILKYDKEGKPEMGLCVHPDLTIPAYDIMLSQLLHLRANEETLLRTANRHPI